MKRLGIVLSVTAGLVLMSIAGSVSAQAAGRGGAANAPTVSAFVIGDGNAAVGSSVTFWGANWSGGNSVSGGSAPSAFKGAATSYTVDSSCHGSFSSGPGNTQPSASIPEFVTALVTSSVSKSGSSVTGTVTGMVTIHVDSGYASNPGHPGTGTVVADACPQETWIG